MSSLSSPPDTTVVTQAGLTCTGLTAAEADKVGRVAADLHRRFAAFRVTTSGCHAVGRGERRALCFVRPDGRIVGCVAADVFLAAPDEEATDLITYWVG